MLFWLETEEHVGSLCQIRYLEVGFSAEGTMLLNPVPWNEQFSAVSWGDLSWKWLAGMIVWPLHTLNEMGFVVSKD